MSIRVKTYVFESFFIVGFRFAIEIFFFKGTHSTAILLLNISFTADRDHIHLSYLPTTLVSCL